MPPKMGRPKSENPLTIEVKARIDAKTNEKLIPYCSKLSVTVINTAPQWKNPKGIR